MSGSFPPPRPFQLTAHERLREGAKAGHRCQVIMAPTGGGKTYLGMQVINEAIKKGRRAAFICDRRTLVDQTSETADKYGLSDHGVQMAGHWRRYRGQPLMIASAQTLARREWRDIFDVIIVDECHTQYSATKELIASTRAAVVGLSATPFSDGLGKAYSNLINAATMHELTESGVLVPMRVFSCRRPDMRGAKTVAGEWSSKECSDRGMEIIGDVVSEWSRLAYGKKTIVFGADIKHCEAISRQFVEAGVMAAVFCAHTKDDERQELLQEYRKPDSVLRVLVSVEALAKGFDVPDVECVVDARPLRKSIATAIQMWGRGLRSSPGKSECILIDHSGNILRMREDFESIYFNGLGELDEGAKLEKKAREEPSREPKPCPKCGYTPFVKRCVACGHQAQSSSAIVHDPGVAHEITIGKVIAARDTQHLWEQCCSYTRQTGNPETAKGRAAHLYRDITGGWPPKGFWFDPSGQNVPISRAITNKARQRLIAFAKARKAA